MASNITRFGSGIRTACAQISSLNILSNQIRHMAHNPKWMREQKAKRDKFSNLRLRLLSGTFKAKKTPSEMRKSKVYASHRLPGPISGPVIHMTTTPIQSWVFNLQKERVGITNLDSNIFGADLSRQDLVHKVVIWQLAKRRSGTHQSLNRSTITGTGRKPHPQKKSGRARASTLRSPLHYHGARAFPRRMRDYGFDLPIAIRRKGLMIALSAKREAGRLVIIDAAISETHKTAELTRVFDKWESKKTIVIHGDHEEDPNFVLAARNIPDVQLLPARGANVYDVMRNNTVFITLQGLRDIEARLTRVSRSPVFAGQSYTLLPIGDNIETVAAL